MTCIDELLTVARAYAAAEGIELKTVSSRLFDDAKKLDAIVNGADLQTRRFESAMAWMSENWPASAVWPPFVARPVREAA